MNLGSDLAKGKPAATEIRAPLTPPGIRAGMGWRLRLLLRRPGQRPPSCAVSALATGSSQRRSPMAPSALSWRGRAHGLGATPGLFGDVARTLAGNDRTMGLAAGGASRIATPERSHPRSVRAHRACRPHLAPLGARCAGTDGRSRQYAATQIALGVGRGRYGGRRSGALLGDVSARRLRRCVAGCARRERLAGGGLAAEHIGQRTVMSTVTSVTDGRARV
jgi:hypothetical protein